MKDNVLKKEFKEKDVQRLRNLVTKKYGEKISTSVGFTNNIHEVYVEGDIWEIDGKKLTIKDGIKQNVTKLDKARETINFPLFCPSCKKKMKPHLDKKWFQLYQHCFDCQIDFEHKLHIEKKYEVYEKQKMLANAEAWLKEAEAEAMEIVEAFRNPLAYINSDGTTEVWTGAISKEEMADKIEKEFKLFKENFINKLKHNNYEPESIERVKESN
jgi:hypothetical protein